MTLDIFIAVPVLIAMLLGFRDGLVRKLFSLFFTILGLYVAQITQYRVGKWLQTIGIFSPERSTTGAFLFVFLGICILQMIVYRLALGKYRLGGFADRIAGFIVGFMQGMIFISTILMVMAIHGSPRRSITKDSKLYKPTVNIAPQILDIISTVTEESKKALKAIEDQSLNENATSILEVTKSKTEESR